MKKKPFSSKPKISKAVFILVCLFFLAGAWVIMDRFAKPAKVIDSGSQEVATRSAFSKMVEEAKKEEEKKKLLEEEKERQQEETKKFIETYGPCRYVPILMYHHVGDKNNWLYVRPETFAKQMDYLAQKGYTTVSLVDVMDNLVNGKALPPKPVVLTFDDGYQDNYLKAYPVLSQRGLRATFFLITQLIGGDDYLTWEQAKEMAQNPLVIIGDHTLSHRPVTNITVKEVENEIVSAKSILEENLGIRVNTFAYPYGNHNGLAEKILKDHGFAAAVTSSRGLSCAKLPYELPRIRVGNFPLSSLGL